MKEEIIKKAKEEIKGKSGITLIALVVTIVVLLILAAVTINIVFSDNGIIKKAQEAKDATKNAIESDNEELNQLLNQLEQANSDNGSGENRPIVPSDSSNYDGSYSDIKKVNTPKMNDNMIPVKYDGENWVICQAKDNQWYDYLSGNENKSKWANVMMNDLIATNKHSNAQIKNMTREQIEQMAGETVSTIGSMFVWIPRYAYSITSNYHNGGNVSGNINMEFLKGTSNTSTSGRTSYNNSTGQGNWNIHPAFDYGGSQTAGLWVAKFEASNSSCTQTESTGQYNGADRTLQVVPNVTSWRSITISNVYSVCANYNTTLNSHMMKNIEWGAVAYLSQSAYGRNNTEVTINNSSTYITGNAGESVSALSASGITNTYNTSAGQLASSTGNIYGIYDMSGGAWEFTAAYVNNANSNLTSYGVNVINAPTKNKDVYNIGANDNYDLNYQANSSKYGDAVWEVSKSAASANSWFQDYSSFSYGDYPFIFRGGRHDYGTGSGLFVFYNTNGTAQLNYSFRPVLIAI